MPVPRLSGRDARGATVLLTPKPRDERSDSLGRGCRRSRRSRGMSASDSPERVGGDSRRRSLPCRGRADAAADGLRGRARHRPGDRGRGVAVLLRPHRRRPAQRPAARRGGRHDERRVPAATARRGHRPRPRPGRLAGRGRRRGRGGVLLRRRPLVRAGRLRRRPPPRDRRGGGAADRAGDDAPLAARGRGDRRRLRQRRGRLRAGDRARAGGPQRPRGRRHRGGPARQGGVGLGVPRLGDLQQRPAAAGGPAGGVGGLGVRAAAAGRAWIRGRGDDVPRDLRPGPEAAAKAGPGKASAAFAGGVVVMLLLLAGVDAVA